jgi:phosphatidylglycerophosphate synthase
MPRFIILVEGRRPGFRTEIFRVSVIARMLNELALVGETAVLVVADTDIKLDARGVPRGIDAEVNDVPAGEAPLTRALSIVASQSGSMWILPADRLFSRGFLRTVRSLSIDKTRATKVAAFSSPVDSKGAVLGLSAEAARDLLAVGTTEIASVAGPPLVVGGFSSRVDTPREIAATRRLLMNSVKKTMSADGVVAYYLMRPLTTRITGVIARTPVTPNQLTILTFLIGLTGAALVAWGDRTQAVAGACLFFAAATADCLDGELARLRYETSYRGAWLDTITDDLQTMMFIGACGMNLVRSGAGTLWPILAAVSMALFAAAQWYVYGVVHGRYHSADPVDFRFAWDTESAPARKPRPFSVAKYFFKRDFYTLVFMLLVVADAVMALVLVSTVANGIRAAALVAHVSIKHRRR